MYAVEVWRVSPLRVDSVTSSKNWVSALCLPHQRVIAQYSIAPHLPWPAAKTALRQRCACSRCRAPPHRPLKTTTSTSGHEPIIDIPPSRIFWGDYELIILCRTSSNSIILAELVWLHMAGYAAKVHPLGTDRRMLQCILWIWIRLGCCKQKEGDRAYVANLSRQSRSTEPRGTPATFSVS